MIDTNGCHIVFFRSKTRFHSVASIACFCVVVSNGNRYQAVRIILRSFQRSLWTVKKKDPYASSWVCYSFISTRLSASRCLYLTPGLFLVHQINPSTYCQKLILVLPTTSTRCLVRTATRKKKERVENIIPHYAVVVKASGQRGKEQDLST